MVAQDLGVGMTLRRLWRRGPCLIGQFNINDRPIIGARVRITSGVRFVAEVLTDSQGFWQLNRDPERKRGDRYDIELLDDHGGLLAKESRCDVE